jgi:FXSXX-COOH protein
VTQPGRRAGGRYDDDGTGGCSEVEAEREAAVPPLVDVSHVRFSDLRAMPPKVLAAAIERVLRDARDPGTRDRKFESALIQESAPN